MTAGRRAVVGLLALALGASSGPAGCASGGADEDALDLPSEVTLREPEGSYPAGLPNDPAFFPRGVWLETAIDPADIALDRSFGLNMYVGLAQEDLADFDQIERNGMHLLLQATDWADDPRADHPAVDGWVVYDEADLLYGAGWDDWTGEIDWNSCVPAQDAGGQCGYTVMEHFDEQVPDGELRYANYGMGILRNQTDDEAEVFVNGGFQDVVSADDYAFTHPHTEAGDRRGVSYGQTVARVLELDGMDGERQPVWGFVEVGHPFTEEDAPTITAPEMRSAVWHSVIAGARGIVYFNHSFGGPCVSYSVLRDGCDPQMAPAVTEVNARLDELAPVLNAPFADGYVAAEGPVEVMAKRGPDGAWYVLAAAATLGDEGGEATLRVASGSTVEVLFEDRELPVDDGVFEDTFADGNAVHIYRVT